MHRLVSVVLDALVPEACAACAAPAAGTWVCPGCIAASATPPPPVCVGPTHSPMVVRAATRYEPGVTVPAAMAVRALKFDGRRRLVAGLATLMDRRIAIADDALLIPVPLHPRRLRRRGFNQAVLLARALARRRGVAYTISALRRLRDTPAQAGLTRSRRHTNLADAFRASVATVHGQTCVLVDDVCTTGATLAACGRALEAAGAASIEACVVARATRLSAPPSPG